MQNTRRVQAKTAGFEGSLKEALAVVEALRVPMGAHVSHRLRLFRCSTGPIFMVRPFLARHPIRAIANNWLIPSVKVGNAFAVLRDLSCSPHYVRSKPYRGVGPAGSSRPTCPVDMTDSRINHEAFDVSENDEEYFSWQVVTGRRFRAEKKSS